MSTGVLFAAVDPATAGPNGLAVLYPDGKLVVQTLDSIAEISQCLLAEASSLDVFAVVGIERVKSRRSGNGHYAPKRFESASASARVWAKQVQKWFRRRNRVEFIDPHVWQTAFGISSTKRSPSAIPGATTKDRAHWYVEHVLCHVSANLTEHEADALCLLRYLLTVNPATGRRL